ncbi:hypothetical protein N8Z85_01435 [Porticoccus sp.]|nr:hypothetical protein [Porticoccus sp.]
MGKTGFSKAFSDYDDKDFKNRKKYGRYIFWIAVSVEILAMTLGLYIAWTQTNAALIANGYKFLPPEEQNMVFFQALGAAGPFVIIAIIEPTKLALAYVIYNARRLWVKALFCLALILVTFVTFETIFNGILQQNILVSQQAEKTRNMRQANFEDMEQNRYQYFLAKTNSAERIRARFRDRLIEQENEHRLAISDLNSRFKEEMKSNELKRKTILAGSKDQISHNESALESNKKAVDAQKQAKNNEIKEISNRYQPKFDQLDNRRKDLITSKDNDIRSTTGGILGFGKKGIKQEIRNKHENDLRSIDQERKITESRMNTEIREVQKNYNLTIQTLEANQIALINQIKQTSVLGLKEGDEELNKIEEERNEVQQRFENRKNALDEEYQLRQNNLNNEEKQEQEDYQNIGTKIVNLDKAYEVHQDKENTLKFKFREQVSQIQIYQITKTACGFFEKWCFGKELAEKRRLKEEAKKIDGDYKNEFNALSDSEPKVAALAQKRMVRKNLLDKLKLRDAGDDETYKMFKKMFAEAPLMASMSDEIVSIDSSAKFDVADLPEEKIQFVKGLWFGSIAFIVAIMGTFLAYGSFVLRDKKNFEYKPTKAFSRIALRLSIRTARIIWRARDFFKEVGIRTGDGIRILFNALAKGINTIIKLFGQAIIEIIKIIAMPFRAFSKVLADWRRSIREPKIKYIEKEVEVIVEKIVNRDVEVEKIVYKEVPKEIVRKEMVFVPLYSAESGSIQVDSDLIKPNIETKGTVQETPKKPKKSSSDE